MTLNGVGIGPTAAQLSNISGQTVFNGPITLATGAEIGATAGTLTLTSNSTIAGTFANGSYPLLTFISVHRFVEDQGSIGSTIAGITMNGANTVILAGNNSSFAGPVTVNSGQLRLRNNNALGTGGNNVVLSGGALELDGVYGASTIGPAGDAQRRQQDDYRHLRNVLGNNTYSGLITLASAANMSSNANTLTITGGVTGSTFNLSVGGAGNVTVSTTGLTLGAGGLTKNDTGTLTLAVANTYYGPTTINFGTVADQANGALGGTSGITVATGGTLQLQGSAGSISIAAPLTISGIGGPGRERHHGQQQRQQHCQRPADAGRRGANLRRRRHPQRDHALHHRLRLHLDPDRRRQRQPLQHRGHGHGRLVNGAGTWTLSGASTYTGATTVNAGTLVDSLIGGTNVLPSRGSALTLTGGNLTVQARRRAASARRP